MKWKDKVGEVSWESCFYLDKLPKDTIIFQQTRDPLKVLRAFMRERFFENRDKWLVFAEKFLDFSSMTLHDKYLYLYWELNTLIEKSKWLSYRIEDIESKIMDMCVKIGCYENDIASHEKALKLTPKNLNSRAKPDDELITWDTFPNSELKEKVQDMAVRYGYGIN